MDCIFFKYWLGITTMSYRSPNHGFSSLYKKLMSSHYENSLWVHQIEVLFFLMKEIQLPHIVIQHGTHTLFPETHPIW
jgi:hypothetical protein